MRNGIRHQIILLALGLTSLLTLGGCSQSSNITPFKDFSRNALLVAEGAALQDFGTQLVESYTDRSITITNAGIQTATQMSGGFSLSAFQFKSGSYPGTGGTCGTSLPPGESCVIVMSFYPTYVGTFTDGLQINYHNGQGKQLLNAPLLTAKSIAGAPGTADTSFNFTGFFSLGVSTADDEANAMLVLPDKSIVAAGSAILGGQMDFALIRRLPDATADLSFGGDGEVSTDFAGQHESTKSLLWQVDNKLVATGSAQIGGRNQMAIARYTSLGVLDTTFGTLGRVTIGVGSFDCNAFSASLQADSKILLGGNVFNGTDNDGVVVRLLSSGASDPAFGSAGQVVVPVTSGHDEIASIALQSDNRIVFAGTTTTNGGDIFVGRLNTNGTLDTSFGGGVVTLDLGAAERAYAVALQSDGKILVAGTMLSTPNKGFIFRLNTSGNLDASFGTGGLATIVGASEGTEIHAVRYLAGGKILAAGCSIQSGDQDFFAARLTSTGSTDTTFNVTGSTIIHGGSGSDCANAVAEQANGKYVLAGFSMIGLDKDFAFARIWP